MASVNIPEKPIEIFCGTGGVGKTTLSTSRALFLASQGKSVLLITIDPAKRLKQILGITDEQAGNVSTIPVNKFPGFEQSTASFDALLMSPRRTLYRMGKTTLQDKESQSLPQDLENPILEILTRPNGGMNEIMAMIEVEHYIASKKYQTIILDTPPGKHFIDFLEAAHKIQKFFDKSFIDIFKYLGKSLNKIEKSAPRRLLTMVVSSGVKKLLSYLGKVTGDRFVNTFVDAIVILYNNKDHFLEALKFQEQLKVQSFSNWFLVAAVDQQKILDASKLQNRAVTFMHEDNFLAINKCLGKELSGWQPQESCQIELKNSMLKKEESLKYFAARNFKSIIEFPDIAQSSPEVHVALLAKNW